VIQVGWHAILLVKDFSMCVVSVSLCWLFESNILKQHTISNKHVCQLDAVALLISKKASNTEQD
jgi:hypothetical protein